MEYTAILLSYKRVSNLNEILNSLWLGSYPPKEIILVNNDPGWDRHMVGIRETWRRIYERKDATIVQCGRNFGAMFRPAMATMAATEHVLCIDDDLKLMPRTVENLADWSRLLPDAIIGQFGRMLDRESAEHPYSKGQFWNGGQLDEPMEIDIVFNRLMFCGREKMAMALLVRDMVDGLPRETVMMEEDITTSLANLHFGHKNYLVPVEGDEGVVELSECGRAASQRDGFWESRNRMTRAILDLARD